MAYLIDYIILSQIFGAIFKTLFLSIFLLIDNMILTKRSESYITGSKFVKKLFFLVFIILIFGYLGFIIFLLIDIKLFIKKLDTIEDTKMKDSKFTKKIFLNILLILIVLFLYRIDRQKKDELKKSVREAVKENLEVIKKNNWVIIILKFEIKTSSIDVNKKFQNEGIKKYGDYDAILFLGITPNLLYIKFVLKNEIDFDRLHNRGERGTGRGFKWDFKEYEMIKIENLEQIKQEFEKKFKNLFKNK